MIVKQFRYYGLGKRKYFNQPEDILVPSSKNEEPNCHLIEEPIECTEIRINATPNTKFLINNRAVYIGDVGIYNIEYDEKVTITSVTLFEESLNYLNSLEDGFFVLTFIQKEN